MDIRAVVFDYGGVIIDMRWDVMRALEEAHALAQGAIVQTLYGSEAWKQLEVGVGDRREWLEGAHKALEAAAGRALPPLHQEWRDHQGLIDANVALARSLRPPYSTAVLSNADSTLVSRLRDVHGIYELFDVVVCSAEVGMAKPDPRIYALAAERLALTPPECVFVDDAERNVAAAREAGMHAIHYRVDLGHDLARQLAEIGVTSSVP